MALLTPPRELAALLEEFDIYGMSSSNPMASRANVLLDDVQQDNQNGWDVITGFPMTAECGTLDMYLASSFPSLTDKRTGEDRLTVVLRSTPNVICEGKMLLWNVLDGFDTCFEFPVHWIVDEHCILIPMDKKQDDKFKILETFAGGFGGWSYALNFLRRVHAVPSQIVAIEEELAAAVNFASNHDALLIESHFPITPQILLQHTGDIILHGDVRRKHWWQSVALWQPDLMTISAPCQPWSGAQSAPGLNSIHGMLLPETIMLARIFRPKLLLIEQVNGFATHHHKAFCIAIIKSCGYEVAWTKIVDVRIRWLALAVRRNEPLVKGRSFQPWPKVPRQTPATLKAIFSDTPPGFEQLKLENRVHNLGKEWVLLPPGEKEQFRGATGAAIWNHRCTGEDQKHPTIMAQYGHQHCLPRDSLERKGYFGHFFVPSNGVARLLHPLEIAIMHIFWGKLFVPFDFQQSWLHLGNQISMPHALLAISNALGMIESNHEVPETEAVFLSLQRCAFSMLHVKAFSGQKGTLFVDERFCVSSPDFQMKLSNIDEIFGEIPNVRLKQGQIWSGDEGLKMINGIRTNDPDVAREHSNTHASPVSDCASDRDEEMTPIQVFFPFIKASIMGNCEGSFWVSTELNRHELQEYFQLRYEIQEKMIW